MNKFITQISMVGGVYICKFLKLIALKIGRDVGVDNEIISWLPFSRRITQYRSGLATKVGVTEDHFLVQIFSYKSVPR